MTRPKRLMTAVLAVAAVTVPAAAADAAQPVKPTTVGAHVKKAQGAQARVATLVRRNDVRGAKRVLKAARREAVVAARQARALAVTAPTSDQAAQDAVWSLTTAAGNYASAIEQFSALLPQVSGSLQTMLANAIPGSVAGREQLVQALNDLITKLSGTAQSLAAQAVAALQADSPEQVQALAETVATDLPATIESIITSALSAATQAMQTGLQTLTAIVPSLPEEAQGPITSALGSLSSLAESVLPQVSQITSAVSGIVSQVLSFVRGLMPQLPGTSATTTESAPQTGISGLLSGLTGLFPSFGNLLPRLLG